MARNLAPLGADRKLTYFIIFHSVIVWPRSLSKDFTQQSHWQNHLAAKIMFQSIPSVPILPGHLSFCFGQVKNAPRWDQAFIQKLRPTVELKNRVQMPQPRTTPKLYFPVNKLQIPYYLKSLIIWSKRVKRPTQCKSPIAASCSHSKKDHIHLININDRTTKYLSYFRRRIKRIINKQPISTSDH